jgi:hypothetical protein
MRTIGLHHEAIIDTDGILCFSALEEMTVVGVSLCASLFSGTPTACTIDIQDDTVDVITAVTASTALTPGTWKAVHMGGTNAAVVIAAGSVVEIDLNLTAGTTPTAVIDVIIWYLAGDQG